VLVSSRPSNPAVTLFKGKPDVSSQDVTAPPQAEQLQTEQPDKLPSETQSTSVDQPADQAPKKTLRTEINKLLTDLYKGMTKLITAIRKQVKPFVDSLLTKVNRFFHDLAEKDEREKGLPPTSRDSLPKNALPGQTEPENADPDSTGSGSKG
jgi:hypothetical protein